MNIVTFTPLRIENVHERNIGYKTFNNVFLTGRNMFYPNILLYPTKRRRICKEKSLQKKKKSLY